MGKELELIAQVASVGDLRNKLTEAEEAKVDIEAILLKRVCSILMPNKDIFEQLFDITFFFN